MLTADMLREKAGEEEFALGKALFHRALVREARRTKEEAAYIVSEEDTTHVVRVSASGVRCDCGGRMCRHGVAAALAAIESGVMQEMEKRRAQMAVPALFEAVSSALPPPTVMMQSHPLAKKALTPAVTFSMGGSGTTSVKRSYSMPAFSIGRRI